jgi:hypothetical protein
MSSDTPVERVKLLADRAKGLALVTTHADRKDEAEKIVKQAEALHTTLASTAGDAAALQQLHDLEQVVINLLLQELGSRHTAPPAAAVSATPIPTTSAMTPVPIPTPAMPKAALAAKNLKDLAFETLKGADAGSRLRSEAKEVFTKARELVKDLTVDPTDADAIWLLSDLEDKLHEAMTGASPRPTPTGPMSTATAPTPAAATPAAATTPSVLDAAMAKLAEALEKLAAVDRRDTGGILLQRQIDHTQHPFLPRAEKLLGDWKKAKDSLLSLKASCLARSKAGLLDPYELLEANYALFVSEERRLKWQALRQRLPFFESVTAHNFMVAADIDEASNKEAGIAEPAEMHRNFTLQHGQTLTTLRFPLFPAEKDFLPLNERLLAEHTTAPGTWPSVFKQIDPEGGSPYLVPIVENDGEWFADIEHAKLGYDAHEGKFKKQADVNKKLSGENRKLKKRLARVQWAVRNFVERYRIRGKGVDDEIVGGFVDELNSELSERETPFGQQRPDLHRFERPAAAAATAPTATSAATAAQQAPPPPPPPPASTGRGRGRGRGRGLDF